MSKFLHRLAKYSELCGKPSREEVGKSLGVSGRYIGMIERGEKVVDDDSTLSQLLDLRIEQVQRNSVSLQSQPDNGGPRGLLKSLREKKGLTVAQVAKGTGYSPEVLQAIEDGGSQMGEKQAVKVAKFFGIDVSELISGSDHPPSRDGLFGTFGAQPEISLPPGSKARYVPLLSMAQCGTMMAYDDTAYDHAGFLAIDPKDRQAFAVTLAGDSMTPRFEPGDVAIVYPNKQARNGCVVIARLNEDNGGDVMLKLYQASTDSVTLSSYNPAYPPMSFPRNAFAWIYPIASVTKVL